MSARGREAPARIGILVYDGVEPIDLGGTLGVISMARRVLPQLGDAVIAREAGPVTMAGGLRIEASFGVADAPECDVVIVCGGATWPAVAADPLVKNYLRRLAAERVASVCTGALILAASGALDGRVATTRRSPVGAETVSPLTLLSERGAIAHARAVVDDVVVTSGGVSLAIDGTLYLIGRLYGPAARDEVARVIEYDRAHAANAAALGVEVIIQS